MHEFPLAFFGQRVLIALAQKAYLVGVLQLFEVCRILPKLLVVLLDRPRILSAAMDHLQFAIASGLHHEARHHCQRHNDHHRHHEQDGKQHGAALALATPDADGDHLPR